MKKTNWRRSSIYYFNRNLMDSNSNINEDLNVKSIEI